MMEFYWAVYNYISKVLLDVYSPVFSSMSYLRFPWNKLLKVSLTVSLSYIFLEVLFGRKCAQTFPKLSQTFSEQLGEGIGNNVYKFP